MSSTGQKLRKWAWGMYDPCVICHRPARRGGFLLCVRCFNRIKGRNVF